MWPSYFATAQVYAPAPQIPFLDAFNSKGINPYCPQLPTADLAKVYTGDVKKPAFNRGPLPWGGTHKVKKMLRPCLKFCSLNGREKQTWS